MRDIEHIIAVLKKSVPDAEVRQIDKLHPADDDGIWIFSARNYTKTIQLESSTGNCPFLIEHDDMASSKEAHKAETPEAAIASVRAFFNKK